MLLFCAAMVCSSFFRVVVLLNDVVNFVSSDMSSEPQSSSTLVGVSRVEELFVNVDDTLNEEDECNVEAEPPLDTTTKEVEVENPFQVFKKPRRSKVWDDILEPELVNKQWKVRCKYCNQHLSVLKSKNTTHLKRHIDGCIKKSRFLKQQQALNFLPLNRAPVLINLDLLVLYMMEKLTC
ncbi:hypothetical protein V6N12_058642 [Hibiscus sabdariffa]|uniref:BED-type domain-containing protein n=1 Tax=Hibiscus sabdariffa TaxID=183260 RepID=A0ABR2EVF6_9ROSI